MKRVLMWLAAAAAASFLFAATEETAPASGGAAEVEAAWVKAVKAGDLEAVVALYAPDATLWVPGQKEATGTEAIRASYAGMLGANTVQDVTLSDTKYRRMGDSAAGWGRFTMTLVPKSGGAPVTMQGRFTEVVERRNGKWVYVADHASEDPPPVPAH